MLSVPLFLLLGTAYFAGIAYICMLLPNIIVSPLAMIGRHTMTLMCIQMIIIYAVKQVFTATISPLSMVAMRI